MINKNIAGKKKRILIAFECDKHRRLVSRILNRSHFETAHASSGIDLLRKLYKYKPHIIILGTKLHGLDGMTASKIIKNCDEYSRCPILVISSDNYKTAELYSVSAIDDFLLWPFSTAQLVKKINILTALKERPEKGEGQGRVLAL